MLKKPPIPEYLLKEAKAEERKRRFASANFKIPPTPANWKRQTLAPGSSIRMNNTIETPTPTKRLKIMAESRLDSCHSVSFGTPNDTISVFQTAQSSKCGSILKKGTLTSAIRRKMDPMLQNIEEEHNGTFVDNVVDKTIIPNDVSPEFGSEISSISPESQSLASIAKDKNITSKWETPSVNFLRSDGKFANNTTTINNTTYIDVAQLSPMVRKITEQIGKQFEQRFR